MATEVNVIDKISSGSPYSSLKDHDSEYTEMDVTPTPSHTFPKSEKLSRKQKGLSVQICEDPCHLENIKGLNSRQEILTMPYSRNIDTKDTSTKKIMTNSQIR